MIRERAPGREAPNVTASGRREFLALPNWNRPELGFALAHLVIFTVLLSGAYFVWMLRSDLPEKYAYDAKKIERLSRGTQAVLEDPSYQNVGELYRFLGLGGSQQIAGIFGFLLFATTLVPLFREVVTGCVRWYSIGIACMAAALGAVYLGTYSKDVFIVPVVILCLVLRSRPAWLYDSAFIVVTCLYASFFRQYWFLVVLVYLPLRVAWSRRPGTLTLLIVAVSFFGVCSIAFPIFAGVPLDSYRDVVNSAREGSVDAQTAIHPLLASSAPAITWVNTALVFASLLVPFPLLIRPTPFYLAAGLAIVFLWIIIFYRASQWRESKKRGEAADSSILRLAPVVFSLLIVQAIFEPDYGSFIRHLTPVVPLIIYASIDRAKIGNDPFVRPGRSMRSAHNQDVSGTRNN